MSRAADLMTEANSLAQIIQHMRAGQPAPKAMKGESVPTLEARLAGLWTQIRAARVELPTGNELPTMDRRTRPKWS